MRKKGVVSSTGKARVALEAFKGEHPFSAIAKRNSVHAIQVGKWRKKLIAEAYKVFDDSSGISQTEHEEEVRLLYEEIGRLKVENNFLKKNLVTSVRDRRELIDPDFGELSIRAQCALLEVSRSSYYYEPLSESQLNLALMRIIDALHLDYPFAGSRMMQGFLQQRGELVNRKRVQRLMRLMGIEAIFPAKSLSRASSHHIKFPYLLRGLAIQRCN